MKILKEISLVLIVSVLFLSCSTNSNVNADNCDTVCEYSLAAGETAGTAATSIEGTYNLTFHFPQGNAPFTDGTTATFTLENNILTVEIDGQECITIKNPRLTTAGSTEIQFRDTCRDQLSYDVSMTATGELNEINLSAIDGTWLGQFNDH